MKDAFLKRKGLLAVLLLAALFLVSSSVGERGFLRLLEMFHHRQGLEDRVMGLEEENGLLAGEVERLRDDPQAVEELARTRMGMARPGEVVFILPGPEGEQEP